MATAKKKSSVKTASGRINKSAWIRSQPASLSAKDVVSKAKGENIKLSLAQVYTARSTAKKATGTSKVTITASHATGARATRAGREAPVSGDLRKQFVMLAVRVGIDQAQQWLDQVANRGSIA